MTETSFMHLSSEQELVHNRLRFQKWPPRGPKNSKSLYLTPCLRTSVAGKHGGGVATGGGVVAVTVEGLIHCCAPRLESVGPAD